MKIRLPANGWAPRDYQLKFWEYFENGGKRYAGVWHRRAGKDENCLHLAAVKAHERVGGYWHMLPEAAQGRKAIWEAINPKTGIRRIDEAFPLHLRERTRENEMVINFKCGSSWQVVGSDNYNSLVGSPPIGVIFSEWSIANPRAWDYIRPILLENDGWAAFIYTPRGPNHGLSLLNSAKASSDWLAEVLTVEDTGVFTPEQLAAELDELKREHGDNAYAIYNQEYMCSFHASIVGAYYGREMEAAEKEGRITSGIFDPALEVHTAWDLGASDATVIWFYQRDGFNIRFVDYYAATGWGLDHYAKVLQDKGYRYGRHHLPHDVEGKVLSGGEIAYTRKQTLEGLGIPVTVTPKWSVDDGINAVRRILPRCWFERDKCAEGINALRQYRREWDDNRKVFYERPLHDWASDPADAMRYAAVSMDLPRAQNVMTAQPRRKWVV